MSESPRPGLRPISIPVVVAGPGSQPEVEGDGLDYLVMPSGMDVYQPPRLPEPEEMAGHEPAFAVFARVLEGIDLLLAGESPPLIALDALAAEELKLVNQILGEGEVGARIAAGAGRGPARVQESIFAGIWRVVQADPDGRVRDAIEIGACPAILREAARDGAAAAAGTSRASPPPGAMNAPAILSELEDARAGWRPGRGAHVVNLTLLLLSPDDIGYMDRVLGTGPVTILSRGYGNCRIVGTQVQNTWRVVYYNSEDTVILDSIEVVDIPEVACAADEDLRDSRERLREILAWMRETS